MFVIGRANKLLGWFHKRTLPEFFVGKMLVREHSYEIERFRLAYGDSEVNGFK